MIVRLNGKDELKTELAGMPRRRGSPRRSNSVEENAKTLSRGRLGEGASAWARTPTPRRRGVEQNKND